MLDDEDETLLSEEEIYLFKGVELARLELSSTIELKTSFYFLAVSEETSETPSCCPRSSGSFLISESSSSAS